MSDTQRAQEVVGISGVSIASEDVDATREAWCRFAGIEHSPALVVGGVAVGVGPTVGGPEGLAAVTLAATDVSETLTLIGRRGLPVDGGVVDVAGTSWRVAGTTGQVDLDPRGGIEGVDHVVVSSTDPDRAAALYGARLGLELRLDRTMTEHRMRGLFFRAGDSVVEVVTRLDGEGDGGEGGADRLSGIAWRTPDVAAVRERLLGAEVDVSEVRPGRKQGTLVATVRDPDLRVPTLLVGPV